MLGDTHGNLSFLGYLSYLQWNGLGEEAANWLKRVRFTSSSAPSGGQSKGIYGPGRTFSPCNQRNEITPTHYWNSMLIFIADAFLN